MPNPVPAEDGRAGQGPGRLADAGALNEREKAWIARLGQRNELG